LSATPPWTLLTPPPPALEEKSPASKPIVESVPLANPTPQAPEPAGPPAPTVILITS
jgi:hypothetical protein